MSQSPVAPEDFAIATVTSDDYAVGTLVMLHSFLTRNPWFRGPIHVFHMGLGRGARGLLSGFPRLAFERCSDELTEHLATLIGARPELVGREARFLSLDAFRLSGSGKLLFLDSDLLFLGDVSEIVVRDEPLVACPDGAALRGNARDRLTLEELPAETPETLRHSFNAGLMVIDSTLRGEATWRELLAHVSPAAWERVSTDHTDQAVLNLHFRAVVALVSAKYNLMMLHRSDSHRHEAVRLADALVLHFNGPAKPWLLDRLARQSDRDPALIRALDQWYDAFVGALTARQLSQRNPGP
jgi:lipopolysaccharide biosynthesis glycosyltransferase